MQSLLQAFINRITGDAELTAILGTAPVIYLTSAPESTPLPFLTLRVAAGQLTHDFSGDRLTLVNVALQIFTADINIALSAAQRLGDLLDNASFNLSSGNLLGCQRTTPIHPAMPGFDSAQNALYTAGFNLQCRVFDPA